MAASATRYNAVAIVLHWAIAIAIAGMIALGWWMHDALEEPATQAQAIAAYQLHKSIGLTILALSVFRLGWRLAHPVPALPETMAAWEKLVAKATHWAFYFIIILMPLTGWLYVSAGWSAHDHRPLEVPTLYFGLFQVPHLFGLSHLADQARASLSEALMFSHSKLAWGAIILAALHAGAALKHHFINRDDVLTRMVPGLNPLGAATPTEPAPAGRAPILITGFALIALALAGAVWAFTNPPSAPSPAASAVVHSHDVEDAALDEHGLADDDAHEADEAHEHADDDHGHDHAIAAPAPVTQTGAPPAWRVASAASTITYSGVHAAVPFEGRFASWSADIRFDPNNLAQSAATVTIQTASASDGVSLHDQSLPGAEWFDVAHHPTATFRTTSIRARGDGYEARGTLTIKGHPIDVTLPFTLTLNGNRAIMDGSARINRRTADLGMDSDPDAAFVSADIVVHVHVEAARAP